MLLPGVGGLVTREDAAALTVSLVPDGEAECWVGLKLSSTKGDSFGGPGVRILSDGKSRVTAGKAALRTTEKEAFVGSDHLFRPKEVIRLEVEVVFERETRNGEFTRVPCLIGKVTPTPAKVGPTRLELSDGKPGRVGLVLKKGKFTIESIAAKPLPDK